MTIERPSRFAGRLTVLSLLLCCLTAGSASAARLVVHLKTDYRPGDEFIQVETFLRLNSTSDLVELERKIAFSIDDYLTDPGERVAEFEDLEPDDYLLSIRLVDQHALTRAITGADLAIHLNSDLSVVMLIPRHTGTAEKTAELLTDHDGDGAVGVGDVVRYTVAFPDPLFATATFTDYLSPDLVLVAGTVFASEGSVVRGNDPGDRVVEVTDLDGGPTSVVQYDAVATPKLSNQGLLALFGPDRRTLIPTDDPGTFASEDETLIDVACPFSACSEELDRCESDRTGCESARSECTTLLDSCETERAALEAEVLRLSTRLGEMLADSDADAVPAVLDLCPGTAAGAAVDDRGCSQLQFCSAVDLRTDPPAACNGADWLGDEPTGNPQDCRAQAGVCRPR